ncbi:hypothetical protein LOK49_LG13G02486 [Camellia lanceoleosa]|uniref:Uncharacterized protein n=1 Tax=Camellia lanceoleosa TaxID=1840588 RepID=A0ACC0FHS4_9ERIC|nr:hypothetical protein LOK49_LG13G02486 [Camellia lanceoleosa]
MPSPFTLVTELLNMVDVETEIREFRSQAPEGCYGKIIKLGPNQRKEANSRKFYQRAADSLSSSGLKIFVGGQDTGRVLMPHDFIRYSKIVFRRDGNEKLIITAIRDTSFFLYRLKGFRFLMGRNNCEGMPEEEID